MKNLVLSDDLIRIAIPTNDGVTIFTGMLGRAADLYIYEWDQYGAARMLEKRLNPYAKTLQHQKTLDVYAILKDCQVILSAKIGKKGIPRLEQQGLKLFFSQGNIKEVLQHVLEKL